MKSKKGIKYDEKKPELAFLLKSFPNALKGVANQNSFGAAKYEPLNWKNVEPERYENALVRHFVQYLESPESIDESGENHLAAVIWNACAIYELMSENKA